MGEGGLGEARVKTPVVDTTAGVLTDNGTGKQGVPAHKKVTRQCNEFYKSAVSVSSALEFTRWACEIASFSRR